MDELIEELKSSVAGMGVDEIALALGDCPNVPLEAVDSLATWLSTLNADIAA